MMAVQREQVVQAAEKLVARGKIEAAIREYRKVLSENPNDANTLNRVGDLYARIERYDEAVRFFTQIAENYGQDGFFVKAIAIYKKIIKLDPTRLEVYERLAELYHRQGLVNEARTQYQVLADYYLKHDNPASALSIYERMAQLEPDNPSHRVKLAELYQQQQLTDKAMGEYRTIAELMLEHGHPDEAEQVYERALDVDSSDLEFIGDAVGSLRVAGHDAAAARLLTAAVRRNPEARALARSGPAMQVAEPEPLEAEAAGGAETADDLFGDEPAVEEVRAAEPATAEALDDIFDEAVAAEEQAAEIAEPEPAEQADALVLDLDADELSELSAATAEAEAALPAEPPDRSPDQPPEASPAPAAAHQTGEIELDLDDVFVLDLDDDEVPASLVQPPPDVAADSRGGAFEVEPPPELEGVAFDWDEAEAEAEAEARAESPAEPVAAEPESEPVAEPAAEPEPQPLELGLDIDADFLEKTAAELQPPPVRSADDLFTEAEVLAKYALEDKAYERLQDVMRLEPGHLEAMALTIRIDLHKRRFVHAASLAESMAATARERGELTGWRKVRSRMASVGFGFDGDRVVEVPEPAPDTAEQQVGRMLAGLLERPRRPAAGRPGTGDGGRVDARIAEIAAEILAPGRKSRKPGPVAPPPEPAEAAAAEPVEAVEPIAAAPPPEAAAEADTAEPAAEPAVPEDSGVTWLDEVDRGAEVRPEALSPPDADFAAEDEFFDLAAELEQELAAEARLDTDEVLATPREQSLEEIVEGFKRGVAENLSDEDYDTHFNLGIAYREMGLLDEAIGEFQLAAKDPGRLVECCSMLGLCFLDKGLPELSVKWYKRGLAAPALSEDDALGLLYDLGNVHLAVGDFETAHEVFVEVYGTNSNYRDVVAKLEEIGSRRG